jgi:hypothetical protein
LFLITLLSIVSSWGIGVATIILLCSRDVGLRLVAGVLVLFVWTAFFVWQLYGNLIEISFLSLNHPGEPSPLWWLNPLFCLLWWIVPLGLLSFIIHTVRIIKRELKS